MKKINVVIIAIFCCMIIVGVIVFNLLDTQKPTVNNLQEIASGLSLEDDVSQPYWNSPQHDIAKGIGGYYFINMSSHLIMFFDSKEELMYPVCGKPDCKHEDGSCNAYLDRSYRTNVYFYLDSLYLMKTGESGIVLDQVASDGSFRKELFEIGTADTLPFIYLAFSEDAVYVLNWRDNGFLNKEEGSTKIRKRTLDGKEDKIVASFSGVDLQIENLKIYNQQVYFTLKSYSINRETREQKFSGEGLYKYNPKDESVMQLSESDVWDYTIDSVNQILYLYIKGDALYKCDLSNIEDSKEKIYESTKESLFCNISYDGKYLYLDNALASMNSNTGDGNNIPIKLLVLDTMGNVINSIPSKGVSIFGDQKYAFFITKSEGKINWKNTNWRYIKKENIEDTQIFSELKSE